MPTLPNFLKKKRTKDSSGSNNLESPITSPTKDTFPHSKPGTADSNTGFASTVQPQASGVAPDSAIGSTAAPAVQQPSNEDTEMTTVQSPMQPYTSNQSNNGPSINSMLNTSTAAAGQTPAGENGGAANTQQSAAAQQARTTKGKYTLNDFQIQRTLGTGSFGRVHLVQSKHNQRFYAIKVLKKAQVVKMKQVEHTNDERKMLQKVKHPFLITLWGTFQDSKNLYMVMDFIEGGELFSLLRKSQVSHIAREDGLISRRAIT